ncbi:MAG: hypothetical protein H6577_08750 [Lewinellaceae bacterium]|nr:hypothetical protein [Saprospiraceae bacterium]MCB9338201.1 hypothetical protein [Lewinellaceae bacterium]
MKKYLVLFALAVFFILQGCIPSLHPIYTTDKLVEVKELPGLWTESGNGQVTYKNSEGKPESWNFNDQGDKSYELIHTDDQGRKAVFEVHVIKLDRYYFMDFYPTESAEEGEPVIADVYKMNDMEQMHLLPVHTFAKLEISPTELKISMFDPDFLKKLLENQQIRIKHEKTESGFVLTASPEELQKFVAKYADVKEAFLPDPTVLKNRLKE